jgi:hypothetical protein
MSFESDSKKPTPPARYRPYLPSNGFGPDIVEFATAVVELQEQRHAADYAPMIRLRTADALLAVRTARAALDRLRVASGPRRRTFLSLLAFPPRR